MTMTAKKKKILFWSVLMLAIILRCIRFGSVPDGINQDEAMGAMDAWALSKYGTDRYGTFLPVHFEAWKYSQMSVLLSYCMVPFIKVFGFCTVTVRLPMLLVSCGAVALVYLVSEKLFNERIAFIAMLLTALNPWQFMQSRWSLDCNLFPHVFFIGILSAVAGTGEKAVFVCIHALFRPDILLLWCGGVLRHGIFVCVFYLVSVEKAVEIPGGAAVCGNIYAGGFAGGDRAGDQCGALWQKH